MSLLEVTDLTIKTQNQTILDHVTISIEQGEWVSIIGESGSGKSVTALAIGGILNDTLKLDKGSILFEEQELAGLAEKSFRRYRGKQIGYIFQDYQGAFTPFITVGRQFDEMLKTHVKLSKSKRKEMILQSLRNVELPENRVFESFPFQLSGGQLQRASIAMAAILEPKLLIADEPTTALDSLSSAAILELLDQLRKKTKCGILFISHDLRHVRKYADKIAIMQQGRIIESSKKVEIFNKPQHPYTKHLLASIPMLKNTPSRLLTINEMEVTTG
nr:ABC transporter ATP-binding protein [Neobacillus sp. Marseille-Q6967]